VFLLLSVKLQDNGFIEGGLMNTAVFDIETSFLDADAGWMVAGVIEPIESDKQRVFRIDRYPIYKNDRTDDRSIVKDFCDALREYDILVSYFGAPRGYRRGFDIAFLQTRLAIQGLPELEQMFHLDCYEIIRNKFKLHRNSLRVAGRAFDLPTLKEDLPLRDFNRAAAGHKKALNRVVHRCQSDVRMTKELYERVAKRFLKQKKIIRAI